MEQGTRTVSTRERMVRAAADLIRTKGVSGTGLREVVAAADAPRGSLQHYFPGGKDQLVTEALLWAAAVASRRVVRAADRLDPATPGTLFTALVDQWRRQFLTAGYGAGCPLVATTADMAAINDTLRITVNRAFDNWHASLAGALIELGVPATRSDALASLMISTLEGAIVQARARQDITPLDLAAAELSPLLDTTVRPRRRTPDKETR